MDNGLRDITDAVFCAMVLVKSNGFYLGVSRKDDHNDIGMPGGKSDPGETPQECALRETMEETGYTVKILDVPPYIATGLRRTCVTYLAEIVPTARRAVSEKETALVGMFPKQAFLDGFSGEYNEPMFKHFGL